MQPQMRPNLNYKTTICHHFQATGSCLRGENCHFAHGDSDLRKKTDPLPENIPLVKCKPPGPAPVTAPPSSFPSNYKTVMCKFYEKGECTKGELCSYAHNFEELRKTPHQGQGAPRPNPMGPRYYGNSPQAEPPMPKSTSPPRTEPAPQSVEDPYKQETTLLQLKYFISRFKEFYSKTKKFEKELMEAEKFLLARQTDQAAGVLETILKNDKDTTPEEQQMHKAVIEETRKLANKLYYDLTNQNRLQPGPSYQNRPPPVHRLRDSENSSHSREEMPPPTRPEGGYRGPPQSSQPYYPPQQQYGGRGGSGASPGSDSGYIGGPPHQMRGSAPRQAYPSHYDQGMSGPHQNYRPQGYRGPQNNSGPREIRPSNYGNSPSEYYQVEPENYSYRKPQY